jgi:AcrR family transcriptional regulator
MPRKPAPDSRERILDTASRLFYERGVHAVGVQEVIDACGCGKNLLYREFPSKDDLHLAYLERQRQQWEVKFAATIGVHTGDPARQLLAVVQCAVNEANDPEFHGCPFAKSNAEYPDESHPVHQAAQAQRTALLTRIGAIATETGAKNPEALAARIVLILDGINTNGAIHGGTGASHIALDFAEETIRHATM